MRRDTPFGQADRTTKKALYAIDDPFIRMWTRVVAPNRSVLAAAPASVRRSLWKRHQRGLEAEVWEELSRRSVVNLAERSGRDDCLGGIDRADGVDWGPARRHWRGNDPEFDVVAESVDGSAILIGEVKWTDTPATAEDLRRIYRGLVAKGLPRDVSFAGREVRHAVFVPEVAESVGADGAFSVVTADDVMAALRG